MDYKKRAGLYLLRKKGKAISILLLIMVVSTFLISCFSLLDASEKLANDIRQSIGAAFYLRASTGVGSDENGEITVTENHIHITDNEIKQIRNCGDLAYCNPINYGYAKGELLNFIPGEKHTEDNNMGQVTALNYSALETDFVDEVLSLTTGRHITEEDTNAILISSALASANDLSAGDKIVLSSSELGEADGEYMDVWSGERKKTEVTIVGIYDILQTNVNITATAGRQENRIYASLDVLTQLEESKPSVYTGEVGFYVTDPATLDEVISKVQQIESIDWKTHFIRTNDFQYSQIADGLLSLGDLIKILFIGVSVVSAAILTLILTMRSRGRIPEAGILLSAGIPKQEIIPANCGYVDYTTMFENFGREIDGYTQMDIYVEDPVSIQNVYDEINDLPELRGKSLKLSIETDEYEIVKAPLETLQSLVNTMIMIIIIVSSFVLTLLFTLWIRGRKKEIGVYLSIGKSKAGIIGQFFAETVTVALVAFGTSVFSGGLIAGKVSEFLISRVTTGEATLHVEISAAYLLPVYLIGIAMITVAVVLASWTVFRLKPRDILSRMS